VYGDRGLDYDAVLHHLATAETMSFLFPWLRRSLVIDLRSCPEDVPLIRVMPTARSAGDRLRSLRRLRPHLPRPKDLVVIPWPTYVRALESTGVWDRLLGRLAECGSRDALDAAASALDELRQIERCVLGAIIRGERYETIWARRA
jgi:hypothetical protein